MNKLLIATLFLISISTFAQLKGTVTDSKGNPIPFANIYVKDTYISTSTNDKGNYTLNIKATGNYTVLYQYLGYKTNKQVISILSLPQILNVSLYEEEIQLTEVIISKKENPAIAIIKNAIANRKENSKKTSKYTADFYSRGIFKVKDLPKKFEEGKVLISLVYWFYNPDIDIRQYNFR